MRGHPVHPCDDIRVDTDVAAIKVHSYAVQKDAFGNAVGRGTDHARHRRAVTATVHTAQTPHVVHDVRPTLELRVGRPDPAIDEVDVYAGAGGHVGVGAVERDAALIDSVEPPGVAVR